MQRRIEISKHLIIDSHRSCNGKQRVAESRHIGKELFARTSFKRIEMDRNRIRKQKTVSAKHLFVGEYHETRRHLGDQLRVLA